MPWMFVRSDPRKMTEASGSIHIGVRLKWNTDLLAQFVACASLLKYLPMYSLDTTSADIWACRIMRRFRFRGRLVAGAPMLLCRWNS
jgi:hypothetical protein